MLRVTENQIDHIYISQKWRWSLLDVLSERSADIASDHPDRKDGRKVQ